MYFVCLEDSPLFFSIGETLLAIPTTACGGQRISVIFKDGKPEFHKEHLSGPPVWSARMLFVLLLPIMPIIILLGCVCYYSSDKYKHLKQAYQASLAEAHKYKHFKQAYQASLAATHKYNHLKQAYQASLAAAHLEHASWSPPTLEPHELDLVSLDNIDEKNDLQAIWQDHSNMPCLTISHGIYFYPPTRPDIVLQSLDTSVAYTACDADKHVHKFTQDRGLEFLRIPKRTVLEGGLAQERLASRGEVLSDLFLYQQDSTKFDDAIKQLATLLMHFSSDDMLQGRYQFANRFLASAINKRNLPVFGNMPNYSNLPLFLSEEGKGCIGLRACRIFKEGFNEKSYAALYAFFPLHHNFLNAFKQKYELKVDQTLIADQMEMGTLLLEHAVLRHKNWLSSNNIAINSEPELPISEAEQNELVDVICRQFTTLLNESRPSVFSDLSQEEQERAHTIAGDSNAAKELVIRFTKALREELKNAHNIIPIPLQGEYAEPGDAFARRTAYIQMRPFLQKIGLPEEGELARIEPNRQEGPWCQWLIELLDPALAALCQMKKLHAVSRLNNPRNSPEEKLGIRY